MIKGRPGFAGTEGPGGLYGSPLARAREEEARSAQIRERDELRTPFRGRNGNATATVR
jgi:hypothetical protein